ncbi:hypothetical protein BaRGS_00021938 [Batillaria attramentaria]|uniref:Uncharacterized protein n=1 Tax=Batillaria attramentaria TaxID=370345 RepID=A0ABD0KHX5_9CAEN
MGCWFCVWCIEMHRMCWKGVQSTDNGKLHPLPMNPLTLPLPDTDMHKNQKVLVLPFYCTLVVFVAVDPEKQLALPTRNTLGTFLIQQLA